MPNKFTGLFHIFTFFYYKLYLFYLIYFRVLTVTKYSVYRIDVGQQILYLYANTFI